MKSIQVSTKLHSTGSHKGSSSVKLASMKNIMAKPRMYKSPSPKTVLYTLKNLMEVALMKSMTRKRIQLSSNRFSKDLDLFKNSYVNVCFFNFLSKILRIKKTFPLSGSNFMEGSMRVYLLGVSFRESKENKNILLSGTGFSGKILSQMMETFVHVK